MKSSKEILEFYKITEKLASYTLTDSAEQNCLNLEPYLEEGKLKKKHRETTEARTILDKIGTPPMTSMKDINKLIITAVSGGMLLPTQLEYLAITLTGVRRLKDFLDRCKPLELSMAYYSDDLEPLEEIKSQIQDAIRGGMIDDGATLALRDIRRSIEQYSSKIKEKADSLLRAHKDHCSDSFVVNRNGHLCLPVKKEYKFKVDGSVIEKSSTGNTLFIEPVSIAKLSDELSLLKLDEDNEERKILYSLTGLIADASAVFEQNLKTISILDFIFARGKLSVEMNGRSPVITTERYLFIKQGRHPLLDEKTCVPLDFEIGKGNDGVIITGPNTGGKTVALKTVGLFAYMAQCGLHLPCESATICMNSNVLCDIGDGQNISENLSTFSAHITNVLDILRKVNRESLVLLDELGSGTDPAEGMGIAISILEELKNSDCLFVATTHYPEVKNYANGTAGLTNARMGFDRETLKPLYRLELGQAGESCALHIAARLGMPASMCQRAFCAAYGTDTPTGNLQTLKKEHSPKIIKQAKAKVTDDHIAKKFNRGDSVLIHPEKKTGIVCLSANEKGAVLVQLQKDKILVNHKRLELLVPASQLYPEDYDFSIVFDTVENRKARHQMGKGYQPGLEIKVEAGAENA